MTRPTISNASPEEVAEALLARDKKKLSTLACRGCGKNFLPLRSWQRYCSTKCRSSVYNTAVKQEIDSALRGLIEENKALRARIQELEGETSPDK
jgi:uncharacterized OB-fold protein